MERRSSIERGEILQGTYEIIRRVAAGGMGEVFEAKHARLPGRFAVKVLSMKLDDDPDQVARFRQEAEIASSLHHPNIVQVIDFNQKADGSPYIVMEYLEGRDLAAEIKKEGPIAPRRAVGILGQIAAALSAAHGRGIVHRDLKPHNVFLVPVGGLGTQVAKVLDFGISKVRAGPSLTSETGLLGTPQYMSPEQAESRSADVDGRTDEFALAAIAYEMLSGQPAFGGDNVPAILFKIKYENPAPLAQVSQALAPFDAAIAKGLSKKKEERYLTVMEFAGALSDAALRAGLIDRTDLPEVLAHGNGELAAGSVTTKPDVLHRGTLSSRRNRFVIILAAGAVMVLLLTLAIVRPDRGGVSPLSPSIGLVDRVPPQPTPVPAAPPPTGLEQSPAPAAQEPQQIPDRAQPARNLPTRRARPSKAIPIPRPKDQDALPPPPAQKPSRLIERL